MYWVCTLRQRMVIGCCQDMGGPGNRGGDSLLVLTSAVEIYNKKGAGTVRLQLQIHALPRENAEPWMNSVEDVRRNEAERLEPGSPARAEHVDHVRGVDRRLVVAVDALADDEAAQAREERGRGAEDVREHGVQEAGVHPERERLGGGERIEDTKEPAQGDGGTRVKVEVHDAGRAREERRQRRQVVAGAEAQREARKRGAREVRHDFRAELPDDTEGFEAEEPDGRSGGWDVEHLGGPQREGAVDEVGGVGEGLQKLNGKEIFNMRRCQLRPGQLEADWRESHQMDLAQRGRVHEI